MDLVQNPLEEIHKLFATVGCPSVSDNDFGVSERFQAALAPVEVLSQVPFMTPHNVDALPNNSLVRFRGMVQDMLNPEFYMGAYKRGDRWHTTKFHDPVLDELDQACESKVCERKPLYCIPVPGQSSWSGPSDTTSAQGHAGTGRPKRGREADEAGPMDVEASAEPDQVHKACEGGADCQPAKRGATEVVKQGSAAAGSTNVASSSATDAHPGACMVYVYDDKDTILLHEVVEVVGVMSKVPAMAAMHMEAHSMHDDNDAMQEHLAAHPPTSQVVRLHAILIQRQPALVASLPAPLAADQVQQLRSTALDLLSFSLGGDRLAAEYLLLQLLGRVIARSDSEQPVGLLPLNITHCPKPPAPPAPPAPATLAPQPTPGGTPSTSSTPGTAQAAAAAPVAASPFAQAVQAAVAALVPLCSLLPLSVESCNQGNWTPSRDYATNRISKSPLQLASGTVLLLDETAMSEGQLGEAGLASLQSLFKVVQHQQLTYNFQFYQQSVPVSLSCVVMSVGRSLIKEALPLAVQLQPTQAPPSGQQVEEAVAQAGPVMAAVRSFLAAARELDYRLSDDMNGHLQQEFIRMRKESPAFSPDEFHIQLTLARLSALSFGEPSLTQERWRYAQQLENSRLSRARVGH